MYVLDLLKCSPDSKQPESSFEYRLLCSGALYNSRVLTAEWYKSDAARSLFAGPFRLIVCSHPFDDYPQELCLRFNAPWVTEKRGDTSSSFYPDELIARDLAAILSLLLRRLITVAAKTGENHPPQYEGEPDFVTDLPVDFVNRVQRVHWARKPATVVYGRQGVETIMDYNPPPLGVDPLKLGELLIRLASSEMAGALVLSARLYAQALRQLEHEVDLAYQSLVSCAETIANEALRDYQPVTSEMISIQKSIVNRAVEFGLEKDKAEALAIAACSGMSWISKKFIKFLVDNAGDGIWEKDDLFHPLDFLLPKRSELERAIRSIYQARSGSTHAGRAYPGTASVGFAGTLPRNFFLDLDILAPEAKVPPAVWFERLVHLAIKNFIASAGVSTTMQQQE